MGVTLLTINGLFAPLQQFFGWAGRPVRAGRAPAARSAVQPHRPRRPLRVVRVLDGCHAPASAGRMVISGRMADVCAELDRLAALEGERAR